MSVIVVGLNHRTAPFDVLERAAVAREAMPGKLHELAKGEHTAEAVLLSTCNRTEAYVRATKFHPAVAEVTEFLSAHSGVPLDELSEYLYTFHDDAAVAHLFGVASGIDSMILGESEILGQVKQAWQQGEAQDTVRQHLAQVFRHAIEVGKRARTETDIARRAVSVSSAAVWLATERLGSLRDRRVVVLGAGKMGEGMAKALSGSGVAHVAVANRSPRRAAALADRVGGAPITLDDVPVAVADADVLLASTGSGEFVVTRAVIEEAMSRRPGRPLLVVDVAVPRDVEPASASVPAVTLLDIDDLKVFVERSMDARRGEVERVRQIIAEEVERHRAAASAREVAPLVAALRQRGEEIRVGEIERFAAKLSALDPEAREAVEAVTRGIVNKLLHDPTVRAKESAGDDGSLADALVALFDL